MVCEDARGRGRTSASVRTRELREVGRLVGDLRPGRRDEVVEEPRSDVALRGRQRLDRALEVIGDDLARTTELVERRGAQRRRAARALDVPEPLHHELQVRAPRSPRARPFPLVGSRPARPSSIRPVPTPSSTSPTSASSIVTVVAFELAPALERLDDRRATGGAVEVVEAEDVAEQVRDRRLEPVERGERVLAQREQHVDPQRAVDEPRERSGRSRRRRRGT